MEYIAPILVALISGGALWEMIKVIWIKKSQDKKEKEEQLWNLLLKQLEDLKAQLKEVEDDCAEAQKQAKKEFDALMDKYLALLKKYQGCDTQPATALPSSTEQTGR